MRLIFRRSTLFDLYFLDAYLKYITAFGHYNEVHDTVTRKNTMLYSVFQDYKPTSEGFNLEIGEDPETHDPIYLFDDSSEVFYLKKTTGLEEVELKETVSIEAEDFTNSEDVKI